MNRYLAAFAMALALSLPAQAHDKGELTGQWIDNESGDFFLDLGAMTWSGIDDGCKIKKVVKRSAIRWRLTMRCTADDRKPWTQSLDVRKDGDILRVKGDRWTIEMVPSDNFRQPYAETAPAKNADLNDEIWQGQKGPGLEDIKAWTRRASWGCFDRNTGDTVKCPIAKTVHSVRLLRADGAQPSHIFFVGYGSPGEGNALEFTAALFERGSDGRYVHITDVDGYCGQAESADFRKDALYLTSATLAGNDARCCPSGRTVYKIDYKTGKASYFSGNKV